MADSEKLTGAPAQPGSSKRHPECGKCVKRLKYSNVKIRRHVPDLGAAYHVSERFLHGSSMDQTKRNEDI